MAGKFSSEAGSLAFFSEMKGKEKGLGKRDYETWSLMAVAAVRLTFISCAA